MRAGWWLLHAAAITPGSPQASVGPACRNLCSVAGLAVLVGEHPDQAVYAVYPHFVREARLVIDHQADPGDLDVVDLPAGGGALHLIVDREPRLPDAADRR